MSDQPTPTPPWKRDYVSLTGIEKGIVHLHFEGDEGEWWTKAWSELCTIRTRLAALERVANEALNFVSRTWPSHEDFNKLKDAVEASKGTEC